MLHIAGASLSCPHNFFNEKASILHAAPKKFGGRPFLKRGDPSTFSAHGQISITIGRGNKDLISRIQRPNVSRVAGFNNASGWATTREVRPPNFSTTTFSTKFSQKLRCSDFEM